MKISKLSLRGAFGRIREIFGLRKHEWTCETHGSWVNIKENGKLIYEGPKEWMPKDIRKRYNKHVKAIDEMWREVNKFFSKDNF